MQQRPPRQRLSSNALRLSGAYGPQEIDAFIRTGPGRRRREHHTAAVRDQQL
jgi:hypothetical protein